MLTKFFNKVCDLIYIGNLKLCWSTLFMKIQTKFNLSYTLWQPQFSTNKVLHSVSKQMKNYSKNGSSYSENLLTLKNNISNLYHGDRCTLYIFVKQYYGIDSNFTKLHQNKLIKRSRASTEIEIPTNTTTKIIGIKATSWMEHRRRYIMANNNKWRLICKIYRYIPK